MRSYLRLKSGCARDAEVARARARTRARAREAGWASWADATLAPRLQAWCGRKACGVLAVAFALAVLVAAATSVLAPALARSVAAAGVGHTHMFLPRVLGKAPAYLGPSVEALAAQTSLPASALVEPIRVVRVRSRWDLHPPAMWLGWGESAANSWVSGRHGERRRGVFLPWLSAELTRAPCPVMCEVTSNGSAIDDADALVYEPSNAQLWFGRHWRRYPLDFPQTRGTKPWRKTVAVVYEVPSSFDSVANVSAEYDWLATYALDAQLPISLFCGFGYAWQDLFAPTAGTVTGARPLPALRPLRAKIPAAVYIASRCSSADARARDAYVAQLARWFPVVSFGECLHNADMPGELAGGGQWPRPWHSKIAVLSRYAFYLAFENANVTDWITEKPMHGWLAGTVPVVMGARLEPHWSPGAGSHIHVADFDSPAALGLRLAAISRSEAAYNDHFAWRQRPPPPAFVDRVSQCAFYADCRLCLQLAQARHEYRLAATRTRPPNAGSGRGPKLT
ncbi:Alpha3-fucosyltransferase [Thecamonas trahens ATCC 50062]|uniref:Fucosyltransferase n=1 Tax=Thecamonas trahens ATCC 50062 TaxID=461836 RepID=A0A0L0DFY4_THETB|nr:Alpha3-fucosyltransferase [Thecamonas trahens ATCC 50062]KNC50248.1 Alpha3-fucosyltransferase [Thecamonas trahens ATCC 50062]|eukprot:XP_013757078.1 Alpha3-fucosyltransferase [Thecamonas trahens ATCC 50062]